MSGIKDGDFDRVTIARDLAVGSRADFGTAGQVLKSGGQNRDLTWGSNSATLPEGLTAGDNITFTPSGVYNGSVATTISTTTPPDGGITTLNGGDGIIVEDDSTTEKTIKADLKSGSGLVFTGGEIDLENIPNTALANSTISGKALGTNLANLVEGDNITFSTGTTYNGSTEITISSTAPDGGITTLNGGDGIIVENDSTTEKTIKADLKSGSGLVFTGGEIDLASIPNTALANSTISGKALGTNLANLVEGSNITFDTGTTYNGSTEITISATDTNTEYTGGNGIEITIPDTINADLKAGSGLVFDSGEIDLENIPNTALANSTISGKALGTNLANLVEGSNITFDTGTTYNGSTEITISATDTNTEYTGTAPIDISASDVISLNKDDTLTTISDNLSVVKVPNKLRAIDSGLLSTGTITIGGSTVGTYDGSDEKYIQVAKVPNTLTITQGANSVVFNGSSTQSITLTDDTVTQTLVNTVGGETGTNYLVYNVVEPTAYNNTLYPIDSNYNITGMTATHRYYHATVSFVITGATTFLLLNKLIHGYFRIDSANDYQSGYFRPVAFWTAFTRSTTTPPSSIGHELLRVEFSVMIDLGASYSTGTHDFYPVVGQYIAGEPVGVRPTNKTIQISYGGVTNKLFLKLTPIDAGNFTDFTTANPFTIPPSGDDY